LLPCPFCGATSTDFEDESSTGCVCLNDPKYNKSGRSFIQCGNCGITMHEHLFSNREKLVKRWNTRASNPTPSPKTRWSAELLAELLHDKYYDNSGYWKQQMPMPLSGLQTRRKWIPIAELALSAQAALLDEMADVLDECNDCFNTANIDGGLTAWGQLILKKARAVLIKYKQTKKDD
jgi:hypothetical protein